jgi:molybdenum cofactor guanylyltransferase
VKLLGAVIAGGKSTRFGGDKAEALMDGKPLIEHATDALGPQVDALIVVGRGWQDLVSIPDYPKPDGGPLFGLCAALRHAHLERYDAVLTCGCDTHPVPVDLRSLLGQEGPSVIDGHWLFGLWPADLAPKLEAHIAKSEDHSLRSWVAVSGARRVPTATMFRNINRKADLP